MKHNLLIRFSRFTGILEGLGISGSLFPLILIPLRRSGDELWPETLGGISFYRLRRLYGNMICHIRSDTSGSQD